MQVMNCFLIIVDIEYIFIRELKKSIYDVFMAMIDLVMTWIVVFSALFGLLLFILHVFLMPIP